MRLQTITLMTATFLLASAANAATYYVATTGSDSANGSVDTPFRTINKAAAIAKPGDVVNVRGGVYTDRVSIYSKGTAAAPIVFRAMAGETPILDGANVPSDKGVVQLTDTEYVDFSGFEVRNSKYIGIILWHAKNTRVLNNHVHHTTRNGIYAGGDVMGGSANITVSGNSVHDAVLENQYHNMNGGGWAGAIVVSKTERATITDNKVWNNDGEGIISLRGNHYLVRGNEVWDNFSVNVYLDNARFVTVDRNLIYTTGNTRYYRNGFPAVAISIANETKDVMNPSSDNVFTNNIVIGGRWGFHYGNYESGGGLRNTKVLHNTFYGTTAEILRIENDAHANSLVANNIFYQTGSAAPQYAGNGPVVYQTNLWFGGTSGAAAGTGDILADPRFVNAGGRRAADYRVHEFSPAVHTAIDLGAVGTDYFGSARTPTFDIGAHEQSLELGSSLPARTPLMPPSNVTGSARSSGTVQLSWMPAEDATAYRVYRDRALLATVTTTAWTDLNLTPATTYSYAVTSINSLGGESDASPAVVVTTPNEAKDTHPPVFAGTVKAALRGQHVVLTWDPATDNAAVAGYRVYRDGAIVATVTATTWTDTSVQAGSSYRYDVVAFDAAGNHSTPLQTSVDVPRTGSRGRSVGRS